MRSTINGKLLLVSIVLLLLTSAQVFAGKKREFRGAWIQCVNGQFEGLGTQAMQQNLLHQLTSFRRTASMLLSSRCVPSAMPFTRVSWNLGAVFSQVDRVWLRLRIGTRFNG